MKAKKRLLLIRASDDVCAAEIDHIASIAEHLGLDFVTIFWHDRPDFLVQMQAQSGLFDYVYLGAHAGPDGFGPASYASTSWQDFAMTLCECDKMNTGCVLFLGCCRGGLKGVAQMLFTVCSQIDYVCGPRWTVCSEDIALGFHVFLYNMEIRREQPSCASERASKAANYDFFCYDRVEIEDVDPEKFWQRLDDSRKANEMLAAELARVSTATEASKNQLATAAPAANGTAEKLSVSLSTAAPPLTVGEPNIVG